MTKLQISLSRDEADALARWAASELRDPRDQIRLVVRRELERTGYLRSTEHVRQAEELGRSD